MVFASLRRTRLALAFLLSLGLVAPATLGAQTAATTAVTGGWLYRGSDIPPDPEWKFGELPNGLRYAIRKNGVPPGQVAIRVDIEAGSLMETDSERGFAHYLEHLSFRGSRHVTDGEAKRVWQRLGATFGSDTNASTTTTQTIYKLDLPSASPEGLDESLKILSGMMAGPTITPAEVDAERRTVLAEAREQFGAAFAAGEATRQLFFAGQPFASRSPIGTTPTLLAATPETLRAFHDRWYRPERTVVVIVGDAETALFEKLITKHFADWRGIGPSPADPDFGVPTPQPNNVVVTADPGLPLAINIAWQRPWKLKDDTIAYNQGKLVDLVATRLINRRLESRARAGGSYLQAQLGQEDVSRSIDGTFVQIIPVGTDWAAAVRDVRAVIADALTTPPTQAEIVREAGEFFSALQVGVETEQTEAGSKLADELVEAINIRETVASAEVARDVFQSMKDKITPAMILASTQRLFSGVGPRAALTLPAAEPGAEARLAALLSEPVKADAVAARARPISFNALPKLGKPGKIVSRELHRELDLELIGFANGVKLVHFANPSESGKVYVTVRFGRGMQALPSDRATMAWAAPLALVAGGIGKLDQDALDRMTSGRKININFTTDEDAFVLRAQTRASDLGDQLRLMASKLAFPRWDAAPVIRARAAMLAGYDGYAAAPQAVLARDLGGLLHGGDPRWTTPDKAAIDALTPAGFRALWEPLLASGPIEVMVFGDADRDATIKAVAATFGAIRARRDAALLSPETRGPQPTPEPLKRTHKGPADQAAAVLAWPTAGGVDDVYESRKLELLALVFGDRMFDQLRESEGASYSPGVDSNWPTGMNSGGSFSVTAQLKPEGVDRFFTLSRAIATDLATNPPGADEIARAVKPFRERIARASTGSQFWMYNLTGVSFEARRIAALRTIMSDYGRITPAELQATAQRWLKPETSFSLIVMPEGK